MCRALTLTLRREKERERERGDLFLFSFLCFTAKFYPECRSCGLAWFLSDVPSLQNCIRTADIYTADIRTFVSFARLAFTLLASHWFRWHFCLLHFRQDTLRVEELRVLLSNANLPFWTVALPSATINASPSNEWVGISFFVACDVFPPVGESFVHQCLHFFYKFECSFRAANEVAAVTRASTQCCLNFSLLRNQSAHPILSVLVVFTEAESVTEDRCQRRRPTLFTARMLHHSKAFELSGQWACGKVGTKRGRILP